MFRNYNLKFLSRGLFQQTSSLPRSNYVQWIILEGKSLIKKSESRNDGLLSL